MIINIRKIIFILWSHKILVTSLIIFLIIIGLGIGARSYLISKMKLAQKDTKGTSFSSYSPLPATPPETVSDTPTPSNTAVLGTSDNQYTLTTPAPLPTNIPNPTATPTPIPSPTPTVTVTYNSTVTQSTSSGSSPHSCAGMGASPGVPTAWYSETSSPQTVSNTATISIQLRDCNNSLVSGTDTLDISQSSGPSTTINGSTPPISIEAVNGQASFTVSSQTSGTAVYIVKDTSRSFPDGGNSVTDPSNHNPQVTFTISAPTPTPTSAVTPTPTPSSSASPTPTPTPTNTPTPSPTP